MVTAATVRNLQEADAARMRLESSGIAVFLPDEYEAAPFGSNGLIPVRVQVNEADLARAREILAIQDPPAATVPETCPKCGSSDLTVSRPSWLRSMLWLFVLLGIPFFRRSTICACRACGYTWKFSI